MNGRYPGYISLLLLVECCCTHWNVHRFWRSLFETCIGITVRLSSSHTLGRQNHLWRIMFGKQICTRHTHTHHAGAPCTTSSICLGDVCLSVYLSVRLSVTCLSVRLSVCLVVSLEPITKAITDPNSSVNMAEGKVFLVRVSHVPDEPGARADLHIFDTAI